MKSYSAGELTSCAVLWTGEASFCNAGRGDVGMRNDAGSQSLVIADIDGGEERTSRCRIRPEIYFLRKYEGGRQMDLGVGRTVIGVCRNGSEVVFVIVRD